MGRLSPGHGDSGVGYEEQLRRHARPHDHGGELSGAEWGASPLDMEIQVWDTKNNCDGTPDHTITAESCQELNGAPLPWTWRFRCGIRRTTATARQTTRS